jgi:hypothetical protein
LLFCGVEIICSSYVFFIISLDPKMYGTGFKKSAFSRCLDDLQICSSNVFFIKKYLDPDPNPDPQRIII